MNRQEEDATHQTAAEENDRLAACLEESSDVGFPSRPDLVFRLGIVGSRDLPDKKKDRLERDLRKIFQIIAHRLAAVSPSIEIPPYPENLPIDLINFYSPAPPRLHLVSGLAEGADALAAEIFVGLETDNRDREGVPRFSQSGVIGFPFSAYKENRSENHRPVFEQLAKSCTHVVTLDGPADPFSASVPENQKLLVEDRLARADRAQNELILRNCDLLLAVAGRSKTNSADRTLESIRSAQNFRIPVLFLDLGTDANSNGQSLRGFGATFIEPDGTLEGAVTSEYFKAGVDSENLSNGLQDWVTQIVAGPAYSLVANKKQGDQTNSDSNLKKQLAYLTEFFDQPEVPGTKFHEGRPVRRKSLLERIWVRFLAGVDRIPSSLLVRCEEVSGCLSRGIREVELAIQQLKIELGRDSKSKLPEWLKKREEEQADEEAQKEIPAPDSDESIREREKKLHQARKKEREKLRPSFECPAVNCWRRRATTLNYHYSGLYRGTFVATYLLAVITVLLAGISLLVIGGRGGFAADILTFWDNQQAAEIPNATKANTEEQKNEVLTILLALAVVKIGCILAILRLTTLANSRRWNERAINYRYLAERLRVMHLFPQLGSFHPPASGVSQTASRAIDQGILDWLFDSILRCADTSRWIPHAGSTDVRPRLDCLDGTTAYQAAELARTFLVEEQIDYHRENHQKMHHLHRVLGSLGDFFNALVVFIVATDVVLIIYQFTVEISENIKFLSAWLVFLAGLLPAIAAALQGIRFQSECQRLADRSLLMTGILETHGRRFDELLQRMTDYRDKHPERDPNSWTIEVLRASEACSRDLIHEASEWSVLYSKEMSDPGI